MGVVLGCQPKAVRHDPAIVYLCQEIIGQFHMVTPSGTDIQDRPLDPERPGRRVKVVDRIPAVTPTLGAHSPGGGNWRGCDYYAVEAADVGVGISTAGAGGASGAGGWCWW